MSAQTFRELCKGKVSTALQAMIDGLRLQSQRKDFRVDMTTFGGFSGFGDSGDKENPVCFGCAATCTIQQLSGVNFTDSQIFSLSGRSRQTIRNAKDLDEFEDAIDSARLGHLIPIFDYMGNRPSHELIADPQWILCTDDWQEQLPLVQDFVNMLKLKGL